MLLYLLHRHRITTRHLSAMQSKKVNQKAPLFGVQCSCFSHKLKEAQTLYLLKGELRRANVLVREGLRREGRLQRDFVYCPEPEPERPKPPLSLKQGRTEF